MELDNANGRRAANAKTARYFMILRCIKTTAHEISFKKIHLCSYKITTGKNICRHKYYIINDT